MGGQNLVHVLNVVVAAIFDFMTVEDWVVIVTLTVGARAKEGKGGGEGGGEKKKIPARYHCSFGKLCTLANGGIGK